MGTILDRLVDAAREELKKRRAKVPLKQLADVAATRRPTRDFVAAITAPRIRLIAEVKRASPSKGDLNPSLDAASLARQYQGAGAAAVSVLTEPTFFKGALSDLAAVSSAVGIPVLRKDFVVDAYQIYEARAHGADAVLLIAAILSDERLSTLLGVARRLGMGALVEVHDAAELKRFLATEDIEQGTVALGINNRNLADFTVNLQATIGLRPQVPEGVAVVSESGIHSREDVLRLESAGVNAILVGEALVTSENPGERIRYLLGW